MARLGSSGDGHWSGCSNNTAEDIARWRKAGGQGGAKQKALVLTGTKCQGDRASQWFDIGSGVSGLFSRSVAPVSRLDGFFSVGILCVNSLLFGLYKQTPHSCLEKNIMITIVKADALHLPLGDNSVDLVIGSSPFCDCRKYYENGRDLGISRKPQAWIEWMLKVTREACRVSRGLVLWSIASPTRDWCYQPAAEGLQYEWWKAGGQCWRPLYVHRFGIPGSGFGQWFRADIEYILAFKREKGRLPWANPLAMAKPPKSAAAVPIHNRQPNGKRRIYTYVPPKLANPGNLIEIGAGSNLGHPLAHENEAPYSERLVEFLLRSCCPPGGTVCDPFCGSGTTIAVARKFGYSGIGFDIRQSQVNLALRRVADHMYDPKEVPDNKLRNEAA